MCRAAITSRVVIAIVLSRISEILLTWSLSASRCGVLSGFVGVFVLISGLPFGVI